MIVKVEKNHLSEGTPRENNNEVRTPGGQCIIFHIFCDVFVLL